MNASKAIAPLHYMCSTWAWRVYVVAVVTLGIAKPVVAADCNELLRLGYANIRSSVSKEDSITLAFHSFCSADYASATSSKRTEIAASFDYLKKTTLGSSSFGVGLAFGSESASIAAAQHAFCDQGTSNSQFSSLTSVRSFEISDSALSAWQRCLELDAKGLRVGIRRTANDRAVTIELSWGEGVPPLFSGIDQPLDGKAKCVVSGEGVQKRKVRKQEKIPLSASSLVVSCSRQPFAESGDLETYAATRLTVKTGQGSFDIDFEPMVLGRESAAEMADVHARVSRERNKTRLSYSVRTPERLPSQEPGFVTFDQRNFDNSGSVRTTPTWEFVAPHDGKFLIVVAVRGLLQTPNLSGIALAFVDLVINDQPVAEISEIGSNVADVGVPFLQEIPIGTVVRDLKAGDVVRVMRYASAASEWDTFVSQQGLDRCFVNIVEL